jgi:hypothetical protein
MALLCAGPAFAGPANGWVKRSSSLLHYDSSGTLSGELPLGRWEEPLGGRVIVHETRGSAARGGSFAWTWETVDGRAVLRFFGPSGRELWSEGTAAAPESGEPLVLSAGGETSLLCRRSGAGLSVAVKSFVGNTLWEIGPFPILHVMELTDNGRYALLRWSEPDKSATHTFLDLEAKARKDVPSGELLLGQASVGEDGTVRSGGKTVFSLAPKAPPAP